MPKTTQPALGKPHGYCTIRVELDDNGHPIDWTFIHVNEELAKIEGKSQEELTGHRFFEVFPNGNRKWLRHYYDAAYRGLSVYFDDISEEIGLYLHVEAYPTGQVGYCACVICDIKENIFSRLRQQEAQEALLKAYEAEKKRNAQIRHYAKAMGIVYPLVISIDYTNNRYDMVEYDNFLNKTAAYAGTVDELVNVGASTIPDPKAAEAFLALFNRKAAMEAFRQGKKELALRHPQNGDDGKVHYMDTHIICTECSDEKITAISVAKCIDEEAERDRALLQAAEHAEVIGALSTIYTTIIEADLPTHGYRIVQTTSPMEAVMGGKAQGNFDEVMEDVLTYFIHPDDIEKMRAFVNLGTLATRMGKDTTLVTEYRAPYGKWFESRFIAKKHDAAGRVISAIYASKDVTPEKQKELHYREQLKSSAVEAERANTSKTSFLRRMSHDIRTPLNGIVGMLHIMDRFKGDKDKYEECMDKILRSTDYLLNLVNNVLDISKMESGAIELEYKPFDLAQLLLNTLPVVAANASQHSIAFCGGQEDTHITHRYLVGSPVHLNRVLMNLASNAIKYNHPGGSLRIYCNELRSDGEQATYEFVCSDTGLGMSEDFQKHAFEPFTQEGKETTTSFSGSGLGLSIVNEIVKKMGGTIELESKENVGTTIRIVLTMTLDKNYRQAIAEKALPETLDLSGCRALLVEDNDINMEIAGIMLEELGLEIVSAENGRQGLDIFRESEPYTFDFIFMDVMMPVMDGLEATKAIRTLYRPDAATVPIIAMTANAFAEDRRACLDAGMNDHIGKPIDTKNVISVLRKYAK